MTIGYNFQAVIQAYQFERILHIITQLEKELRCTIRSAKQEKIKAEIKPLIQKLEEVFVEYEEIANKDFREDNSEWERRARLERSRGGLRDVKERWEGKLGF